MFEATRKFRGSEAKIMRVLLSSVGLGSDLLAPEPEMSPITFE